VSGLGLPKIIDWNTAANKLGLSAGQSQVVSCPAGGTPKTVWGSGPYTEDSNVCTAGVHAGLITLQEGGSFKVTKEAGMPSYQGSTAHDISTQDYGAYPSSFSVSGSGGSGSSSPSGRSVNGGPRPLAEPAPAFTGRRINFNRIWRN
jgi:hypothetical protein